MLSNQHFLLNRKCAIIAAHNRQLQKRILFVRRRWFWRGCCCWFSQLVFLCLSYILTLFSQFRCLLLAATQECVSNNGKVTTHRLPTAKIESYQKKIPTFIVKQNILRPNVLGSIHLRLTDRTDHPLDVFFIKLFCFSSEFNETWWSCSSTHRVLKHY